MYVDLKTILFKPLVPQMLFVFFIILFIWQIVTNFIPSKAQDLTAEQATQKITIKPMSQFNLTTPLFGDYVPTNLTEAGVKQSMRDLEVVGIIFDTDEKKSHIIIQSEGGIEKILYTGDTLPGGGVIKRITQEGVLVGENGDLESLSLPKNELIFEPPAKPLIGE